MDIHDFYFLRYEGFNAPFREIERALEYSETDSVNAIIAYRRFLEAILDEVYKIINETRTKNNLNDINLIKGFADHGYFSEDIITELHNIRVIGNKHTHYNSENNDRDIDKDKKTCLVASHKISQWLVYFKDDYPKRIKPDIERKEQEDKELKKGLAIGGLGLLGAIFAIFMGGRK